MPRETANPVVALERLCADLDLNLTPRGGGKFHITRYDHTELVTGKTSFCIYRICYWALAAPAHKGLGLTRKDILDITLLTRVPPTRGLTPSEAGLLRSVFASGQA